MNTPKGEGQIEIPEDFQKWLEGEIEHFYHYCYTDSNATNMSVSRQRTAARDFAIATYRHLSPSIDRYPRWEAKESPEKPGKYYCKVLLDGDPEQHVIDWDGTSWGPIEEYDCYEDLLIVAWLYEPSESPAITTDK